MVNEQTETVVKQSHEWLRIENNTLGTAIIITNTTITGLLHRTHRVVRSIFVRSAQHGDGDEQKKEEA